MPTTPKKPRRRFHDLAWSCSDCGRHSTPVRRLGPAGPRSLCNACGLRRSKAARLAASLSVPPPIAKPSALAAEPTAPASKPSTHVAKPSAPVAKPSAPVAKPSAPVAKPSAPVAKPSSRVAKPSSRVAKPSSRVAKLASRRKPRPRAATTATTAVTAGTAAAVLSTAPPSASAPVLSPVSVPQASPAHTAPSTPHLFLDVAPALSELSGLLAPTSPVTPDRSGMCVYEEEGEEQEGQTSRAHSQMSILSMQEPSLEEGVWETTTTPRETPKWEGELPLKPTDATEALESILCGAVRNTQELQHAASLRANHAELAELFQRPAAHVAESPPPCHANGTAAHAPLPLQTQQFANPHHHQPAQEPLALLAEIQAASVALDMSPITIQQTLPPTQAHAVGQPGQAEHPFFPDLLY